MTYKFKKMEKVIGLDFQLLGTDMPPEKVTELLGIKPDVELRRDQRNAQHDLPRQNLWAIKSRTQSVDVADHWHELKSILDASKVSIKELARTGKAKISIVIDSKHRLPSIQIPPDMSEFAGFINAEIDVDHLQG